MDTRIKLAAVAGAHGVRGQVKLRTFTENPADVAKYSPLTDARGRRWHFTVTGIWKEGVIAALEGIATREAAEGLKNTELFAPAHVLPPPATGEYYVSRLEGLAVRDAAGVEIGRMAGVYDFGAGIVLEIEFAGGKMEMYPFHQDFFPEVRPEQGWLRFEKPGEM